MVARRKSFLDKLLYVVAPGDARGVGFFDRMVLAATGAEDAWAARRSDPREARVMDMVAAQSARAGMKPPKLIVYQSHVPNAFSIYSGNLAVGTNLLDIMTPQQVAAVMGHELAHHSHIGRDASVTLGLPMAGGAAVAGAVPYAWRNRSAKNRLAFVAAATAGLGACMVLPRAWQRSCELEADQESVEKFGHRPEAMAGALESLQQRMAELHKNRPPSSMPQVVRDLLATHPPLKLRIDLLKRKAEAQQRGDQAFANGASLG
ncbi:MAG: M48 family metalloprotease [Pseudomonadota bacterium]|nr:M48 family metalloprotease [Pseudomonadota bacterium]